MPKGMERPLSSETNENLLLKFGLHLDKKSVNSICMFRQPSHIENSFLVHQYYTLWMN